MTTKKPKVKAKRKKRGTYENKVKVKEGTTFMDIIGASIEHAEKKPKDK